MSNIWDDVYAKDTEFFGDEPSKFTIACYDIMKKNELKKILEMGCGQGRDCLFFASKNLQVTALDYSQTAINGLLEKSKQNNMHVNARVYDMKKPLPFDNGMFDAVYSHMLFSMRFTTDELRFIFQEVKRVLKSNGFHFFSVRNHNDKFYGKGTRIDDEIYDINGFQIRFFTIPEIESLAESFNILEIKEDYEEPVTLYLVTTRKNS